MSHKKVAEPVVLFCPSCGHQFSHEQSVTGRAVGGLGGAGAGALLGAKIGIVGGPLGAIAGTVPGALLGLIFGGKAGRSVGDDPKCPKCSTSFVVPRKSPSKSPSNAYSDHAERMAAARKVAYAARPGKAAIATVPSRKVRA